MAEKKKGGQGPIVSERNPEAFRTRLKELRTFFELPGKAFAKQCGIDKGMSSYLETRGTGIHSKTIDAICRATGASVDWLLTGTGEMFPEGPKMAKAGEPAELPDNGSGGGMAPEQVDQAADVRKCRVCGCTDDHACEGGCYWVEADLCSKCAEKHAAGLSPGVVAAVLASRGVSESPFDFYSSLDDLAPYRITEIEYREIRKRGGGIIENTICTRAEVRGDPDAALAALVEWTHDKLDSISGSLESRRTAALGDLQNIHDSIETARAELRDTLAAVEATKKVIRPEV
jgi:transcriptional regulator with XRE-family HTH domain